MELKTKSSFVWKDTIAQDNPPNSIVIDHGSHSLKYGFCGTDIPTYQVPTVIGKPKLALNYNKIHDDYLIGNEATDNSKTHYLNYPIYKGRIENWEDMEDIWIHIFTDLNTKSSEHPLLIVDGKNLVNLEENTQHRKKLVETMFESFDVPEFFMENEAVLSLYAVGRTNGLVISSGAEVTCFYPVMNGKNLDNIVRKIDLGGKHITNFLRQTISYPDNIFKNSLEEKTVTNILKEGLCYVALDGTEKEVGKKIKKEIYDLPDGNVIEIGNERFIAPESLFNPKVIGKNILGIPEELINTLEMCNKDFRNDLCNNVLLEGSNTLFPFFPERLLQELQTKFNNKFNKIRIVATEDRKFYSWLGGSIVSSLSTFSQFTIKRDEYFEKGSEVCMEEKFTKE